jgi:Protein of unknown function (DUF4007)
MSLPYSRSFARHETFHPRYGWLRKAVVASSASSQAFLEADATVTLGVGKNMVRAIRYWAAACGLIEDVPILTRPRFTGVSPSPLGMFLLGPNGADPYLEEPTSLWLLHWRLLRPGSMAAAWYLAFNRFPQREFSDVQLIDWLAREIARDGVTDLALGSIEKDVSCLLRMYGPVPTNVPETLVSPFAGLRLIDRIDGRPARHRITYGPKNGLAPEIVALVALDLLSGDGPEARSIGLARLASAESSPGKVFALSENEVATALEQASGRVAGLTLGVFAGARRLLLEADAPAIALALVASLYPTRPFDLGFEDLRRPAREVVAA